ncbi:MAG TPA: efflux RND transporter periplasmic adaptor subunit [Anaerolineales bacterium]|nr:efflux RND transporter periplasmic adaptor subunit [Anaerolineales bacterium]HNN12127.1 efflux RND transporter periplasmic adaptor subunit [Anaerolineales bacterium]HNO31913.1 efflux RND transporter periplasmic adaptor subunit [Anaerolineales bacterium]
MSNLLKNKKFWWIASGVVVIVALLLGSLSSVNASDSAVAESAQVVSLTLTETVDSTGSLEAQPFASLNWKASGTVADVHVQPGDFVKAGDVLLTLDPTSTSASIVSAQADLITAQQNLEDLLDSGTDLAQAAITLKDAQEEYQDAEDYLTYLQNDKRIPQTKYLAKLIRRGNGWAYDYDTETFKGPAPEDWIIEAQNDLALKKAKYEDAQREYDRLLAGDNSQDVIAAQAKVDAAQATVNTMSIIAPFDGQVLSVEQVMGDVVSTGDLSINIADLGNLHVDAQVDESDIAKVQVGDQVSAESDALPEVVFTGIVESINPVGRAVSGIIKYDVRVTLDKPEGESFLPLGSTMNIVIQIGDRADVLAVPITAIQNDVNGEYVWVVRGETTERVDVVGGEIVGEMVVVTGDLREGDVVTTARASSFEAPNPFGGNQ